MDNTVDDALVEAEESSSFWPAGTGRLLVKRRGHSILRSARVPKPVVLVDTREQQPLALWESHPNWIGGERRATIRTGDYTVEGMESLLALERKSLADVVGCTVASRERFIAACNGFPGSDGRPSWSRPPTKTSSAAGAKPASGRKFTPMPHAAPSTPSRRSSGSPSSTRQGIGNWSPSGPPVGSRRFVVGRVEWGGGGNRLGEDQELAVRDWVRC